MKSRISTYKQRTNVRQFTKVSETEISFRTKTNTRKLRDQQNETKQNKIKQNLT